jgi:tight adherence protein B
LRRWATARRTARDRDVAWAFVADELAATIRAGSSLPQALASVGGQAGAAAGVVRAAIEPVERGRSVADAARSWAEAASTPDERLLAEALLLAAVGGRPDPLLFEVVAETIRERRALEGELRAQTAQARASAAVLALLPLGFTGLVASTDHDVTTFLFGTLAGRACIVIGVLLDGLGAWWMRRTIGSVTP